MRYISAKSSTSSPGAISRIMVTLAACCASLKPLASMRTVQSGAIQSQAKIATPKSMPISRRPLANTIAAAGPSCFLISLYRGMKAGRKMFSTDG